MVDLMRYAATKFYSAVYRRLIGPRILRRDAQTLHEQVIHALAQMDEQGWLQPIFKLIRWLTLPHQPTQVGGVLLDNPLILAAGFVKGIGFQDQDEALTALAQQANLIPGWRSMPALVGAVEFGSFTYWAREGNAGRVIWREVETCSTQNRIGLKNPGAYAAARYLAMQKQWLPKIYGINIALSPGMKDVEQETREAVEALRFFLEAGLRPAWFTLNLSCPNTEDDPTGNQTEAKARRLCSTFSEQLAHYHIPLWVKISPDLTPQQYRLLMCVFAETGVRAVIATNTLAMPTPDGKQTAGVGGGRLHEHALHAAKLLVEERDRLGCDVDVIGCGGVMDGATYAAYRQIGVKTVQYWSALIYRGPLAAAVIAHEARGRKNAIHP